MNALLVLTLLLQARPAPATPAPVPAGPVILFLVDNSASLPPLDPLEKRVDALEKMFTFLKGQPYRLILFGGRRELFVDDVTRYRNNGQWTDFYYAFDKVRELVAGYPPETEFRTILITDGIMDPGPADWAETDAPEGDALKAHVRERTLALLRELRLPLYVILVGDAPRQGAAAGDREQSPELVLAMVQAANGARAVPMAQSLSAFFEDDGLLLRKFVFRVGPEEGLGKLEPVVQRIAARATPLVELQFLGVFVLPLTLFLFLLLGVLVRSFPGPGDVEVIELAQGHPVHVAADRLHRLEGGGWGSTGLSLVASPKEAVATLTYQAPALDLGASGLDRADVEPLTEQLLGLSLDDLRKALEGYTLHGSKEEKIYTLNLDYMAKNLDPKEAERILTTPPAERRGIAALDFLRAKAHLLSNDALRKRLADQRVHLVGYGRTAERGELLPGAAVRIGPYGFIVRDTMKGGRKDVRLVLHYDRVPSLFGLKTLLPRTLQRFARLRGTQQRLVS